MKISTDIVTAIIAQARDEAPLEACGYLAGQDGRVVRHFPMTNMDQSEIHFSFDPREQFETIKAAREQGLDLIGVYHSHPTSPAQPSAEDIRLAYDVALSYVIVSLQTKEPDIRSFRIDKDVVLEESVEII